MANKGIHYLPVIGTNSRTTGRKPRASRLVPNHQPVMLYTMYSQFMDAGVGHPNDVAQKMGCIPNVLYQYCGKMMASE